MLTLSIVSAIVSLLSGVTGLITFARELRSDGKLGGMSRTQSVALTCTLLLTAALAGIVSYAERKPGTPVLDTNKTDATDTVASDPAATDSVATDTVATDTVATDTVATDTVASDTSTTTRKDPPPPPPVIARPSMRLTGESGVAYSDVAGTLSRALSASRRARSAITGRVSRNCRPDHAFPSVTACDDTLDVTIRDLHTGAEDGATLTGEGVGSTHGEAARDARKKLIAQIRDHFSGDRP
jgi:hypothetical protein